MCRCSKVRRQKWTSVSSFSSLQGLESLRAGAGSMQLQGSGSERGSQSEPQRPRAGPGSSSFATSNNYGENFGSQASPGSAPKPGAGGAAPSGGRSALRQAAQGMGGPWDDPTWRSSGHHPALGTPAQKSPQPAGRVLLPGPLPPTCPDLRPLPSEEHHPLSLLTPSFLPPSLQRRPEGHPPGRKSI